MLLAAESSGLTLGDRLHLDQPFKVRLPEKIENIQEDRFHDSFRGEFKTFGDLNAEAIQKFISEHPQYVNAVLNYFQELFRNKYLSADQTLALRRAAISSLEDTMANQDLNETPKPRLDDAPTSLEVASMPSATQASKKSDQTDFMVATHHQVETKSAVEVSEVETLNTVSSAGLTKRPPESSFAEIALKTGLEIAKSDNMKTSVKSIAAEKVEHKLEQAASHWLDNTEVSIQGISEGNPTFSIVTVQPVHESEDLSDTVFGQFSIFGTDGRTTLNLGSGYRYMTPSENWLFGVNAFYDHEFPYGHQRMSLGFEARSSVIQLNTNQYYAISGWKTGENSLDEHALDGNDVELGFTLPYMPGSKLYYKAFEWDTLNGLTPIKGDTLSLEFSGDLIPGLTLEVGATDFDVREDSEFVKLTYTHRESQASATPFFSDKAYSMRSVKADRLKKVRRENKIVKQGGGGLTIAFR